jgi:hypothetical protein
MLTRLRQGYGVASQPKNHAAEVTSDQPSFDYGSASV